MLNIEHLSKAYNVGKSNEVQVLRDINIKICRGDEVSIIGKSGSGKTTLLHIMALIDRFQGGDVQLDGKSVKNMSSKQLAMLRNTKIGLVLQDFALISEYTVMENVMLPVLFSKERLHEKKKYAEELLRQTGLFELRKQHASQLSGGQKQRVAVCRALINSPDLILADEPTGSLDTQNGKDIISLLKSIRDEKKALVVITHDLDIAHSFQKQYLLENGVLETVEINTSCSNT